MDILTAQAEIKSLMEQLESWQTTARIEAENRRQLAEAVLAYDNLEIDGDDDTMADFLDRYELMTGLAKGMFK